MCVYIFIYIHIHIYVCAARISGPVGGGAVMLEKCAE